MSVYGKEKGNISKEIHYAERALDDLRTHKVTKIVYDEEKEVVRKALEAYISAQTAKLY